MDFFRNRLFFAIAAVFVLAGTGVCASGQGIRFSGSEAAIDKRTSFEIKGPGLTGCKDSLSLKFEFKNFREYRQSKIGYYFQIRTTGRKDAPSINLLYKEQGEEGVYQLIFDKHRYITELSAPQSVSNRWVKMEVVFMVSKDSIRMVIDGDRKAVGYFDFEGRLSPKINFGKQSYILEVPSFAIRNLEMRVDRRKAVKFKLSEDSGTLALSNSILLWGKAHNPQWLSYDKKAWKREFSVSSKNFLCAGYDTLFHQTYVISRDSLLLYDQAFGRVKSLAFSSPCPVIIQNGTSFVNPLDSCIYVYEMANRGGERGAMLASLNRMTGRWTVLSEESQSNWRHHHSGWFDAKENKFRIFGGYGYPTYYGDFLDFDFDDGKWTRTDIINHGTLYPREFASMGYDKETGKLLIFGGIGNEDGDQFIGHDYYYDLNEVDLARMESKSVWKIQWEGQNRVPGRNMIIPGDGWFYVLFYPESISETHLRLFRFSIKDGEYQELADEIPYYSDRISCNANVYYDRDEEKLIAIAEETPDDISSKIIVYSLSFPPSVVKPSTVAHRRRVMIVVLILLSIAIAFAIALSRRRERLSVYEEITDAGSKTLSPAKNSIFIFGSFAAFDSKGGDISKMFTQKLRQLLILLLDAGDAGITSQKIGALLWPEKEDKESKNIRGVTISKLRKALSPIEGITLKYEDGAFGLSTGEEFYCDYLDFKSTLSSETLSQHGVMHILSRGAFLSFESDTMFDNMKEEVNQKAETALLKEMAEIWKRRHYKEAIQCAEALFNVDPLNDEALTILVLSLRKLRRDTDARLRYNEFVERYKKDYGEEYPRKYSAIRM